MVNVIMAPNYRSISAYRKDGEAVRIYAIKSEMRIADFLKVMIDEYSNNHTDFRRLVESVDDLFKNEKGGL